MTSKAAVMSSDLQDRLRFETLLSDLSSRFVNLPPNEVDREIEGALRRVCETHSLDLAVLWQWSNAGPEVIVPTHSYCVQDEMRPSEPMSEDQYPWSVQQVLGGRMYAVSSLEEFPEEAAVDRETCRQFGIKAGVCLPLAVGGGSPIGALGLNALRAERDWPDDLVKRLKLVAEVFTNALTRKRHELSRQESEARLAAGADLAGLGFYEVDFGAGVMYVDDRMRDLCGVPPELEEGLQALEFWMEHLHPDDLQRVLHLRDQLHDGRMDRLSLEYRFLHPARGERWIQHLAGVRTRDASGRAVVTFGVLRDITERKRVAEEMRGLSQRLIRAHEEERALLARELHDDVTQRLAVLAIDTGVAERAASDGAQAQAMQSIREGLVRLSEDIHSLAYQLHPSVLEELGLGEALQAECERLRRQSRLDLSIELEPLPSAVGKDTALCLFRVAQEALNNVNRHAGAHAASVVLRLMDGGLLLTVRDDGIGFDSASPGLGRRLGLASMRERLQLVNGRLDIESAPGQGTAIVAWAPVEGGAR